MVKYLFIFILAMPSVSFAQEEAETEAEAPAKTVRTVRKKTHMSQLGPRLMMWQENIDGKDVSSNVDYRGRFTAIALSFSRKVSVGTSSRWFYNYTGDLFYGTVKTASESGDVVLESQNFFGVQLSPGLLYRPSNDTVFGFQIPLFYRNAQWDTGRNSLALGQENLLSVGLGAVYQWRVRKSDFIVAGLTYRPNSVLWTIGYDFRL